MWALRYNLEIQGSLDPIPLREFGDTIMNNPMYGDIVAALKERPGFVQKTAAVTETQTRCFAITELVFDTKENFDLYITDPSTISLWDLFEIFAVESGMTVQKEITES